MKNYSSNSGMKNDIVLELFPESKRPSFFLRRLLLSVLFLLALVLWKVPSAKSAEAILLDAAACNSSDTVTQLLNAWDAGYNAQEALSAVNKKVGYPSCLLGRFLAEEVAHTTIVSNATGVWQLTEIKVSWFWSSGIVIVFAEPITMFTYLPSY